MLGSPARVDSHSNTRTLASECRRASVDNSASVVRVNSVGSPAGVHGLDASGNAANVERQAGVGSLASLGRLNSLGRLGSPGGRGIR